MNGWHERVNPESGKRRRRLPVVGWATVEFNLHPLTRTPSRPSQPPGRAPERGGGPCNFQWGEHPIVPAAFARLWWLLRDGRHMQHGKSADARPPAPTRDLPRKQRQATAQRMTAVNKRPQLNRNQNNETTTNLNVLAARLVKSGSRAGDNNER